MIHQCSLSVSQGEYRLESASLGVSITDPAVVSTFKQRNKTQALILAIGETEEQAKADPTYEKVAAGGKIHFFDPFNPSEFSPTIAANVVRYYVAKALDVRGGAGLLRTLRAIFSQTKLDLRLRVEGFAHVSEDKRNGFEKALSDMILIKRYSIEQPPKDGDKYGRKG